MIRSITVMLAAVAVTLAGNAAAKAQSVARYPPGLLSTNNSETARSRPSDLNVDDDGLIEATVDEADVMLQKEIDVLSMERRQLMVQFGEGHPTIQLYDAKIKAATRALANIKQRNQIQEGLADQVPKAFDDAIEASAQISSEHAKSIAELRRAVIALVKRVAVLEAQVKKMESDGASAKELFE